MTFTPVIPLSGYAGWRLLNETIGAQTATLAATPVIEREMDYFRENIGSITSAEELVQDYTLLKVALTAFGLQDDLPNKAFMEKVLAEGVTDDGAFANRLADKSYYALSDAFGFGTDLPPLNRLPGFADSLLENFKAESFEIAVGEVNGDMRLSLNTTAELPGLAGQDVSNATLWYQVMGDAPLREMFEVAMGLPSEIGALDLEKQLEIFEERAETVFGSSEVSQFTDPDKVEDLIRLYLTRSEINQFSVNTSSASIALTLLQAI